jgi:tetratricopeptide (TPR) repeat protein
MLRTLLLSFLSAAIPAALAQTGMAGHVMEMQDEIPPEKLPPPIRMSGIGNAHMDITATPEAQMWFDQGLNLLHDFWDYESARAFEQGIRVDPQCAMCYWGLYKAEAFYHSTTQDLAGRALAQAAALKDHVSGWERLYIDAAGARGAAGQLELLRQIVDTRPHDLQARIFQANSGAPDSLAILEGVLKEDPENSAANHYYIHSLEAGDHPEKALHSAEVLGRLAPASGHMVHMPGHIYFRLGDYARAAMAFGDSLAVDERYMQEQHIAPDNDWNYVHNLMYAIANLLEQGRFEEATRLSAKITGARGQLDTTLYTFLVRDSISRLDPRLPVALRLADFPQILKLAEGGSAGPRFPNLEFLRQRLADFAAGMEAIAKGDLSQAEQFSKRLDSELDRTSKQAPSMEHVHPPQPPPPALPKIEVMPDALIGPLLGSLNVMSLELRGSLAAARGKIDDARNLFAQAAGKEKDLGYREPPGYIRPVGETEGAAMLAARQWADARAAFGRALAERPHSGFALYGIAVANEKAGDREAAAKSYEDFLTAWNVADSALPQLAQARAFLAAQRN